MQCMLIEFYGFIRKHQTTQQQKIVKIFYKEEK